MKRSITAFIIAAISLFIPSLTFAASNAEVAGFTHDSITTLIILGSIATVFFLIQGAYIYITSTGKPESLEKAKHTIKRALIGLVIVIGASVISSFLQGALSGPSTNGISTSLNLAPITPTAQNGSLAQILMDAISGFLQNLVQSATKPITDGIIWFLTNTPLLSTNSVVFNFWLIIVGITDSLLALVVALLGFHVMSASSFGFDELSLKELFPRIGLAFLLANTSIFLIDWTIALCNTLIHAVLSATGGIANAWILNAFDPAALISGQTSLITLIFMIIFIVLAVTLLLFYIGRLIVLAFGAVISPLVCLLWLIPNFTGFAESSLTVYLVTIFSLFVQVVIIQLASAFLTIPGQEGTNPVISVLIGVALLAVLLKSTAVTAQLALSSQTTGAVKKIGGQIMNVVSPSASGSTAAKVEGK
jgi:hypothetical protein